MKTADTAKSMLLALTGSIFLLLAAPSQAGGAGKLEKCLADANEDSHEVSRCYWKHWERMASYGR